MKLSIIGTGYVGLVTGTCFAQAGHNVICVDNDPNKVKLLKSGGMPIYEPGLDELVRINVKAGRLHFTNDTKEGVDNSDVVFIAVPTPPNADGSVDLSFIEGVSREIAAAMTSYKIVVDKSTVPVKTGEKVAETIKRYCKAKVDFDVVSNPEFLREGFAVEDFMKPDRVVIGVASERPVAAMKEIYAPYNAPII
ncbi:MAG: nucleotide sugar dehydrogenase, partial [Limisphaerales bacterium]